MKKRVCYILIIFVLISKQGISQTDSTNFYEGLKSEILLHPGGGFTGYTLKKGQWQYNQVIDLKPGILYVGISDQITISLPINHWFNKAASINLRAKLIKQLKLRPTLAFETHYQYLLNPLNLVGELNQIEVWRLGHNWYNKLNASWKITPQWNLNFSTGTTFSQVLNFNIADSTSSNDIFIGNNLSPDFTLGLDYLAKNWFSLHAIASYGSTFMYVDNTPRKKQLSIALRFAPFVHTKWGVLKNFRIELTYFYMKFGITNKPYSSASGFIYWKWQLKKRNNNTLNKKQSAYRN